MDRRSHLHEFLLKFVIVGESSTGKSCLKEQIVDGHFPKETLPTIGMDIRTRRQVMEDGRVVNVQLWDTAGQEQFRSVTRSYYRGGSGAILVYDISRRHTFDPLESWIKEIREMMSDDAAIMLVGNKSDLESERQVSTEEGKLWAEKQGIMFIESSAKTGQNTDELFSTTVDKAYVLNKESLQQYSTLEAELGEPHFPTKKESSCCSI